MRRLVRCAQYALARRRGAVCLVVLIAGAFLAASCQTITGSSADRGEAVKRSTGELASGLHHEVRGSGPAVLLVHGFGLHSYTWRHLADPLAREHTVITVDLKGFGQSAMPEDGRYSVFDQAELLHAFILQHDLADVTLVGHSFGGAVALVTASRLAEEDPSRLSKLVLIDSVAYEQPYPKFIRQIRMPVLGRLGLWAIPPERLVRTALRECYHDETAITEDAVRVYAAALKYPAARHALRATARRMDPIDSKEIAAFVSRITVPTLILWGREDTVTPLRVALQLHETLPQSRLEIIENCGHIPQEERPEETLRIVEGFLENPTGSDSTE